MLEIFLLTLKSDVELRPCRSLILLAMYLMEVYPRVTLPDWVEALANGNPSHWEATLEVVKDEIAAEVVR